MLAVAERLMPNRVPKPVGRPALRLVEEPKQRSYEQLAAELGFHPAELFIAKIHEFFSEQEYEIYSYDQVDRWLHKKAKEAGEKLWVWRPLRAKDRDRIQYQWHDGRDGMFNARQDSCRVYDRLVPGHALEKVAETEKKFKDEVSYFVSDYGMMARRRVDPDPFVMCVPTKLNSLPTQKMIVIFDMWDEPGFGD